MRLLPRIAVLGASLLLVLAGCQLVASPAPGPSGVPGTSAPDTSGPPASAADRIRLVVDTDVAPDDVTAIASLVRDPRVDLLAITVVGTGEAHCPGGMFVVRSVLTMLDVAPIPVACGREAPLGDAQPFPDEWRAGADSGNGLRLAKPDFLTDSRPAEQVLVDLAASESAAGRTLTVLTLGTLTNLAEAAALDTAFAERVRVVAMLGAVGVPGNAAPNGERDPTAEWNAHADPTAVKAVLAAGFDLTLVPLDATNDVPLTSALADDLSRDHAAGPADLVFELWKLNPYMTGGGFFLWDPLAAAVVRDPTIVTTRQANLRVVEGAGLDGGRLVEDPAGASATVAIAADRSRFEALLLAALRQGAPRADGFIPVGTIEVAVGPDSCQVTVPDPIPRGLIEVHLVTSGAGFRQAFVLATNGIEWSVLEAFAADPDFDNAPAVAPVASVTVEAPGSATGYGTAADGPIGVSCVTGDPAKPQITLRGPFEVAP